MISRLGRFHLVVLFGLGLFFSLRAPQAQAYVWDFCMQPAKIQSNGQTQIVKGYEAQPVGCLGICLAEQDVQHVVAEQESLCDACPNIIAGIAASALPNVLAPTKLAAKAAGAAFSLACKKKLELAKLTKTACEQKGPLGCCLTVSKEAGPDGKGKIEIEKCELKPPVYYGDCYCRNGDAIAPPEPRKTFDSCKQRCESKDGRIDLTQGIGKYQSEEGNGYPNEVEFVNATCFKPEDCADQKGVFGGVDSACLPGQGKCYAPEPVIKLSSPIFQQAEVKGIRGYIEAVVRYGMAIVGIVAAVMFVFGGFKYILGATLASIKSGKETMFNAVIGMCLVLFSLTLLKTVNPDSGRFDQLRVVMINKQQFALQQWCKDFKPASPSKPVLFGFSGNPAGQLSYSEAKFDKQAPDTECTKEYYPEGFSGRRCDGDVCKEKGKACMPCKMGFKECGETKKGNACVKMVMGGNVQFKDGRVPKEITLMAVCNWIQSSPTQHHGYAKVDDMVVEYWDAATQGDSGRMGAKSYVFGLTQSDLDKAKSSCAAKGGLRGMVLGVIYADTEGGGTAGTTAGAVVGGTVGFLTPVPGGMALGSTAGGLAGNALLGYNDALIVTKADCGNAGTGKYKGYADGGTSDHADMAEALYCGSIVKPGEKFTSGMNDIVFSNSMWSESELAKAISGDTPIKCDFSLGDANAPSDPSVKLMSSCDDDFCLPEDPKCNEPGDIK